MDNQSDKLPWYYLPAFWFVKGILKADDASKKVTGKRLTDYVGNAMEKEEKLKKEHTCRYVFRKLLWGTIKGIGGSSM